MNIELNEQQISVLKAILELEEIDENYDNSTKAVVKQILDKLEEK